MEIFPNNATKKANRLRREKPGLGKKYSFNNGLSPVSLSLFFNQNNACVYFKIPEREKERVREKKQTSNPLPLSCLPFSNLQIYLFGIYLQISKYYCCLAC